MNSKSNASVNSKSAKRLLKIAGLEALWLPIPHPAIQRYLDLRREVSADAESRSPKRP